MTREHITSIIEALAIAIPEPKTELAYHSPYTLLVAVVLSAQATDTSVNKATPALFAVADNPASMLALGEEALCGYIRTIGLYRTKAKHIIQLSKKLLEEHQGAVPQDLDALCALPGVGIKTAKVVQSTVFGMPVIAVDTHVHRVANRLGWVQTNTPLATQIVIEEVVPESHRRDAHHLLILHGRYCCTARKPACHACPVRSWCPSALSL
jgi:endonuclease-3